MSKLILLALLSLPLGAACREFIPTLAFVAAGHTLDTASSYGRYELNPVLGRGTFGRRQTGIKISVGSALAVGSWLIARKDRETCKVVSRLNILQGAALSGVAVRNWRLK